MSLNARMAYEVYQTWREGGPRYTLEQAEALARCAYWQTESQHRYAFVRGMQGID